MWYVFLTGFAEPLLYLLSIGIGVGDLVGNLPGPAGTSSPYQTFVAPGLLAAAAMNGCGARHHVQLLLQAQVLAHLRRHAGHAARRARRGLGEMAWALLRGAIYSAAFLVTMLALGLVALVVGGARACPARCSSASRSPAPGWRRTTFMRSFVDFDYVNLALDAAVPVLGHVLPAAPLPDALQWSCVHAALPGRRPRALARPRRHNWALLLHAAYLAVMGWMGIRIASDGWGILLQP